MKNKILKNLGTLILGAGLSLNSYGQEVVKPSINIWKTISSEHAQVTFEYERDSVNVRRALETYEDFGIYPIQGKRKIVLSDNFEWEVLPDKTIKGNLQDSTFTPIALFHENAHIFFKENETRFTEDRTNLRDTLYKVGKDSRFFGKMMDIRLFSSNPLIRKIASTPGIEFLFTESTYINWNTYLQGKNNSLSSQAGHPQDNADEFFTSASTILYFFPRDFFEFVESMKQSEITEGEGKYSGYAELAREIARNVVISYKDKRIFTNEVYQKLELE